MDGDQAAKLTGQWRVCDAAVDTLADEAELASEVRERRARITRRLTAIDRASGAMNHPAIPNRTTSRA